MAGIVSYGVYIPRYRINRKTIISAMGWFNPGFLPGEKAVANHDEDSITMAVAAGVDCLEGRDRKEVDGLYFATTTAPYSERSGATIIANSLDLAENIRTSDFAHSLRAGTNSLLSSLEAVQVGQASQILVCASDCRLGKPGSAQELSFGDASAAFLVGNNNVLASFEGFYNISRDFPDHWRTANDRFDRALEDRWIRDEGYSKFIGEAVQGVMSKYGLEPGNVAKVIYPCLYTRDHSNILKRVGFKPEQIQEPVLASVGESGAASPFMTFLSALEEAKPGENLFMVSYGNGSGALWFRVTDEIEKMGNRRGMKHYLHSKTELTSYEKYLAFRNLLPVEMGVRGEAGPTMLPVSWRNRRAILALCGSRCKRCGTPHYPAQRICVNPSCKARDAMEDYRFSDRKATLFSYTEDHLAFSINPPAIYGMVDFEGGGRNLFDITDCDSGSLKVGQPLQMSFRKKYTDEPRGIHGYFWKAMPLKEDLG